jgi:succinyl-CoA synthetase beta subunit
LSRFRLRDGEQSRPTPEHRLEDGVNLHEFQARDLLRAQGVPTLDGDVASTPGEVEAIARRLGGRVVIKAQVHTGGRGKAGGVKLAGSPAEAAQQAARILGMTIKHLTVTKVLVAPAVEIATESYVGLIMDRESQRPLFMVSAAGGVDIEEVAAATPEKITRLAVDPRYGLFPHQGLALGLSLYRDYAQARAASRIMEQLYRAFVANGASLAEINPLATLPDGTVLALDAKLSIDDNELDRRPDLAVLRDETADPPSEVEARRAGLTFIKLDGNVGCVVNGAGLAMATMDLVKHYGGEPANFLDIGGSSNPEKVVNALRIITRDPAVRVILFNIFGGITRTDDVANGIVAATREFKVERPIVIRLTGTNEAAALRILAGVGLRALGDMDEAVKQAVSLVREAA